MNFTDDHQFLMRRLDLAVCILFILSTSALWATFWFNNLFSSERFFSLRLSTFDVKESIASKAYGDLCLKLPFFFLFHPLFLLVDLYAPTRFTICSIKHSFLLVLHSELELLNSSYSQHFCCFYFYDWNSDYSFWISSFCTNC